ncbi:MAG: PadR family transcriptional regulator [Candidatus Heimdallarchaeota archaeon]|nr:PadR family transcriptional regulator [Candidatus Heimdallarchaeota archaeon]MCK5048379.1 PadR family transcriptional regulator [Candidatus Heimdallarchaeota archaeon]
MAKRSTELNKMRDKWEIQYRKGVIQLMVLAVLNQGESYGYEICQIISEITDEVIDVPIGTVYPLLGRFQQDGLVETYTQAGKRGKRTMYLITGLGKELFYKLQDRWVRYSAAVNSFLTKIDEYKF